MGGLEQRHLDAAAGVIDGLGGSDRFDLALVTGSLVAGLGHAHSDVDVHVVVRDGRDLGRRSHMTDGHEVQLTRVEPAVVERFARLTERFYATAADREQTRLHQLDLWHLIRIAQGRVLLASPRYAALLGRSDPDVVRQVVMANFSHQVGRAAEDADGLLARDDWVAACHTAGIALHAAAETALAATGDTYCVDRFAAARLRRSRVLGPEFPTLWRLLYRFPPLDSDAAACAAAVTERLHAAAALVAAALLHGWERPLERLDVPLAVGGPGPTRSPAFGLSRFSDGIGLSGPGAIVRLGEAVAAVWAALDGAPAGEVAERLRRQGLDDVTGETVEGVIDSLVRRGAARAAP